MTSRNAKKVESNDTAEEKLLKQAKKNYEIGQEAWSLFYRDARSTLEFIGGEQWDYQLRQNRANAGLPVLTANALPSFLRQITNEARQNTPAIQIDPKDDTATKETAEVLSDLIRGIEQHSNADAAYDVAGWYAAAIGLGFIRVISEYEDDDSFQQKLVIKQVEDPETVLMDPNHKRSDGTDSEWCFVVSTITKDAYQRQFGNTKLAKQVEEHGWTTGTSRSNWIRDDEVVIAEYFYKDYEYATLYKVYNNATQTTIISEEKPDKALVECGALEILDSRQIQKPIIRWAKLNDIEILEETTWPGTIIPVIAVKGDESWISGKRKLKGAVSDAKDSQKALNYFFSLQAELVSLAPKAPFIGEIRQFANFEQLWRDANIAPSAYLPYNAVSQDGTLLPPPQRTSNSPDIQAAMSMCGQARDNMKAIFGIYDASLGNNGNETSGKAILARQTQTHTSVYHYYDNLVKAIQAVGNILVETIPTFYADEREVQLIRRNGQAAVAVINGDPNNVDNGRAHDLTTGKYGVVVETGPSYATRRQDSVEHMITMGEVYPNAMPLIADIIAAESDWPGAKQIADRLRLALPPEIQQAEAQDGKMPPEQRAQLAISQVRALTGQLQQLQAHTTEVETEFKNAYEENKLLKMKSSVELEKAGMDHDIRTKQLKLDEAEAELSYRVKLMELNLQERELKIEEGKLAIEGVEAAHELDKERHDRNVDTVDRIMAIKIDSPSANIGKNGPEGIDKSFNTLSGEDIGNA